MTYIVSMHVPGVIHAVYFVYGIVYVGMKRSDDRLHRSFGQRYVRSTHGAPRASI